MWFAINTIIKAKFHTVWEGLRIVTVGLGFFLTSTAHAASSISLAWTANPGSDVSGYRLHYGTGSGHYTGHIDVGNATTGVISNLADGTIYFIALTAYNAAG